MREFTKSREHAKEGACFLIGGSCLEAVVKPQLYIYKHKPVGPCRVLHHGVGNASCKLIFMKVKLILYDCFPIAALRLYNADDAKREEQAAIGIITRG